jgi:hypothetical protein
MEKVMPEKIKKRIQTNSESDNNSSDHDPSDHDRCDNPNDDSDYKSQVLYWFVGNFTAATLLIIAILYVIVRNQTTGVALFRPRAAAPLNTPLLPNFFSAVEDKSWLKAVKFSIAESFSNTKDYARVEKYIKQQKKILSTISLSPANKMALSKTTINWVSASFRQKGVITNGFVLQPREIGIVMHHGLTKEELRSTLLNEIHHVTVYDINRYKMQGKAKTENTLEYPFLNEQGDIDNSLRTELSNAIEDLNKKVGNFILLYNKPRNTAEEKRFSKLLEVVEGYQPKVYRVSSHVSDREIDVVELEGESGGVLYRNNRPVVYEEEGNIQLLCSANKDNSRVELTRSFFYDYTRSYMKLKTLYENRYKDAGADEYVRHSKFLAEASSDIDEFFTPKMKQVFAKRFETYFENYAESYLAKNIFHLTHNSPTQAKMF